MKTYKIMNYEPHGSDVQIGKIIATADGEAVLELNADAAARKSHTRPSTPPCTKYETDAAGRQLIWYGRRRDGHCFYDCGFADDFRSRRRHRPVGFMVAYLVWAETQKEYDI